jgi:hypothetical protein
MNELLPKHIIRPDDECLPVQLGSIDERVGLAHIGPTARPRKSGPVTRRDGEQCSIKQLFRDLNKQLFRDLN